MSPPDFKGLYEHAVPCCSQLNLHAVHPLLAQSLCAPRGVSALLACVSSAAAEKMERAQLYAGELLGILQTPR